MSNKTRLSPDPKQLRKAVAARERYKAASKEYADVLEATFKVGMTVRYRAKVYVNEGVITLIGHGADRLKVDVSGREFWINIWRVLDIVP